MTAYSHEFLALQAALAGEYSLERELGRGGMGVVYLARDVQLDRNVAIKVLPGHLAERAEERERFLREARTAASLSHPHIVPIHRVGEAGGFVFFVMTYVAGETLGERLRTRGPLPAGEAMRVMREVAWALAHAHGRGIVHRDVKPDNILLEEGTGRVLVTDFGIAYRGDALLKTDPGKIMGTAHFMSPEQGGSQPVDGRSDLYSLGVVGYLAASGRLPFEAPSVPVLMLRQSTEMPPALSTVAPGLPTALTRAVDRCLAIDPAARFDSGDALAAALAPASEGRPALAPALRGWLGARNPAHWAYGAWSGIFLMTAVGTVISGAQMNHYPGLGNVLNWIATIAAPLVPMSFYHVSQARRLFGLGFTLADLRGALDVAAEERAGEALTQRQEPLGIARHLLRGITFVAVSATLCISTASNWLFHHGVRFRPGSLPAFTFGGFLVCLMLLIAMNMSDTPILPGLVRRAMEKGLRERLWRSRVGGWIARLVKAPTTSRAIGAGVFRATEAALGLAAADLFAALPRHYREQLAELPATVQALEQRAVQARAELDSLGASAVGADDTVLSERRRAAGSQLASTVAALEGIRLDLLRLHAGSSDLAPLTTLMDAARAIGDDVSRLADAQRDVDASLGHRRLGASPVVTPV